MLKDQRLLVVGGTSGIGLAVAEAAILQGAHVVIGARKPQALAVAVNRLGARCTSAEVDVTDENSIAAMFSRLGGFDHLVSTVKPVLSAQPFLQGSLQAAKQAFDTKFWGQYLLARYAAPCINQSGSITLTSGIAAHRHYRGYSLVAAMNAATEALCRDLAAELAPLRVNCVCTGFVDTTPPSPARAKYVRQLAPSLPLGRLANAEEIAQSYLFLLDNTYATGSTLIVDGGATC